jgi:uncharacterized protein (DUF302 family)
MKTDMKPTLATVVLLALMTLAARAGEVAGLVTVESSHDVPTTTDRLLAALDEKGMTVFSRIDHAAGAEKAGMSLPPTELVIFGNPKVGTALMSCGQTVAIDLPLKALIWQDSEGVVRLSYNTPAWMADRHHLGECGEVLEKIDGALSGFAQKATH